MTPAQIKSARKALKMSQGQFAKALGLRRGKSISEYENGKKTPRETIVLLIKQLMDRR